MIKFKKGYSKNPNKDFCCYIYYVYDKQNDMYYIGCRKTNKPNADIGINYFTTSTNKQFVKDFKENPNNYKIEYRYFDTHTEALEYEYELLKEYNVINNDKFYNKAVTRSNFTKYCTVRDKNNGELLVIKTDDFDKNKHIGLQHNNVNCIDLIENKKKRISLDEFYSNPDRYVGVTKGMVTVYDKIEKRYTAIPYEKYDKNRYVGVTKGTKLVYDNIEKRYTFVSEDKLKDDRYSKIKISKYSLTNLKTNETIVLFDKDECIKLKNAGEWIETINHPSVKRKYKIKGTDEVVYLTKEEFENRDDVVNANTGVTTFYDKLQNKFVTISQEEYNKNKSRYEGTTKNKVPVINIITKDKKNIDKKYLYSDKEKFYIPYTRRFEDLTIILYNNIVILCSKIARKFWKDNKDSISIVSNFRDFEKKFKIKVCDYEYKGETFYVG